MSQNSQLKSLVIPGEPHARVQRRGRTSKMRAAREGDPGAYAGQPFKNRIVAHFQTNKLLDDLGPLPLAPDLIRGSAGDDTRCFAS
jgi:hypothetical protein